MKFDWQKPGHAFEGYSWALAPAFSFEHVHHMMKKLHQILLHVDILPKNKEPNNHGLEPMNPQKKSLIPCVWQMVTEEKDTQAI